jgi:hypothetical protein
MKILSIVAICLLLCSEALAMDTQRFVDGEPVIVRSDTAYVLARTNMFGTTWIGVRAFANPVLVRVLTTDELSAATDQLQHDPHAKQESNVVVLYGRYSDTAKERIHLAAIKPGTYILAGLPWSASMCMGTVRFEAKAGVITDLGTILAAPDDTPTDVPELAAHVRGKDLGSVPRPFVMGLRPYSADMEIPQALSNLPRVAADYHAVGRFPNYFGTPIDRLAPVPGIIDYDKDGDVLDLKDGGKILK